MKPTPTSIDTDLPSPKSARKRSASAISPPGSATSSVPNDNNNNSPHILRRHHHRRRNIAASLWGPDLPSTPSSRAAPLPTVPFNIYKSLLRHQNLFFPLCLALPYASIVSLYAIDKEFHYRFNKFSVSIIHDYARRYAPVASRVFTWILYPELCISDPMLRPMDGRSWLARDVPGFRWVGMVLWRQRVVREVLEKIGEGLGCAMRGEGGMEEAVCKYWVLCEMKSTLMRTAFLQDTGIWTDADIRNLGCFLVKLDMRFTDPVLGSGWCSLSHLLLTQRSLKHLWAVLTGAGTLDLDRLTALIVQTYPNSELDIDAFPWLDDPVDTGVPEPLWGIQMKEGWDSRGGRMESCVEMVIAEGVRRELHVQKQLLDFVESGYEEDAWVTRKLRGQTVKMRGPIGRMEGEVILQSMDKRFGLVGTQNGSMDGIEIEIGKLL